ncbi:MAG: tRNA ((37)-N6)-dimethylallyltransferase MiaA [Bacteroidota bacterium]|jgi:tRNA dimethylallyltransferase
MAFLICLIGPTAIGKTDLAIKLAQHFATEIISADSRQIFKEMTIGTAKPSPEELSLVKHHFVDSHAISEEFSVGHFEKQGLETLNHIFNTHQTAIMAGGSGLYVKAITQGFDELPLIPASLREQLNARLREYGIAPLQEQLKELDPEYYAALDVHNPQRVIRALEVCLHSGKKFSEFRIQNQKKRPFRTIKIGLEMQREALYERINQRVELMMKAGLLKEVESLLAHRQLNALQTVGYQELFEYLDGKCSLEAAVALIKQNTRRFAKRQITWFKRDPEIHWFEAGENQKIIEFVEETIRSA